jgi:hypothetical protein
VRYKAGEKWWTTDPTLCQEVGQQGWAARAEDAYESILLEKLAKHDRTTIVEAAAMLNLWHDGYLHNTNKLDRSQQTRIGTALRAIGFEVRENRSSTPRRWYERTNPTQPHPTSDG